APSAGRGRRPAAIAFAAVLVVFGLAQVLDLPLLSAALQAWPLRALRNNRLTLLAGFGLAALGVLGLDALAEKPPSRRFALLAAAPAALLGIGSLARALAPPAVLGDTVRGLPPAPAEPLRAWFVSVSAWGPALGAVAVLCRLALALRPPSPPAA